MKPEQMEHFVVFRDEDYFAAWPFNGGFWQFADGELAAGFVRGKVDYADPSTVGHGQVDCERGEHVVLRSTDGGRTWPLEEMVTVYTRPALDMALKGQPSSVADDAGCDPTADGFCLIAGYGIPPREEPDQAFVTVSTDRGRTWHAPVRLPTGRLASISPRPSFVVRPDGMLLLFGHGSRAVEQDPALPRAAAVPLVWASWDGGASWGLLAEMDVFPKNPGAIMPYPIMLEDGRIIAAIRRQYDGYSAYTQVYVSEDDGRTWHFLSRVNDWGAPASLTELPDGRIVCVYGYRQRPWGIRARVSDDGAETWGGEIILRDDGGSWDLGYPRTHLRPDGSLITVYYFNALDDPIQCHGGVRHICATIWRI